jgi:hypothetical protein
MSVLGKELSQIAILWGIKSEFIFIITAIERF